MTENRKQHWEEVYARRPSTEVSWYQGEPRLSLEMISHTGIGVDAAIIDIGGGASVLVDRLHALDFTDLTVLDISATALNVARDRLGGAAGDINWIESDVTEFMPQRTYDLWHDRAVFHFLTESEDRRSYIEALNRAIPAGGHLVMAAFAIGGPIRCSGLPIVQYDGARLQKELGPEFELVEQRDETHHTPAGADQLFSFFRLRRRPAA
jgi:2-polyprenyl-3-methyl-5-hydroxy-6-metoxy-1,4-benzoquinol methylase